MVQVEISRLDDDVWQEISLAEGFLEVWKGTAVLRLKEGGFSCTLQKGERGQDHVLPVVSAFELSAASQPIG